MFLKKISLDRRSFLRAAGVTIALPMLDAMRPAFAATSKPVPRFTVVYIPNGVNPHKWTPAGSGKEFAFSPTLSPLEPFKSNVTVLTNLSHHAAERQNDGAGEHSRGTGAFLSGCHAKRTQGADLYLGVTADQIAAKTLGKDTLLPSLEISLQDKIVSPLCDEGYTCAYSNTLSWTTPTTPLPTESDPRLVFERLFGEEGNPKERAIRLKEDRSILDSVAGLMPRLIGSLGTNDKRKVDQYFTSIREVETRLQKIEAKNAASPEGLMKMGRPLGVPEKFEDHLRLMFDMQLLAFQGDITRVSTTMIAREMAVRSYPQIGVPDSHHSLSHHDENPAKLARLAKVDNYHVEQTTYFLGKLRDTQDGENSLLDNTIVLYGGGIKNGNIHSHVDLPVVLIGGRALQLEGGRHLNFKDDKPMSNMLRSILYKMGVESEHIGDSTGMLTEL